jgi:hypothetical protein
MQQEQEQEQQEQQQKRESVWSTRARAAPHNNM